MFLRQDEENIFLGPGTLSGLPLGTIRLGNLQNEVLKS